ncbi:hypothetical protein [Trinickia mobilis]|uniref:hypothetical protein n=1 Tax=Trinickia mobilis TaxID=2816356 RepID=UPI001A8BFFDA|nr:hypothetical protein [Trinickia mobilis]
MKILRTFLVLLLCAVLPLTGLAAGCVTGECSMQQSMAMDDGSDMSATMPSSDLMKSSTGGKAKGVLGKMTAQCQIGCLYLPVTTLEVTRPAGLSSPVVFNYAQSLIVREQGGLWRPPRSL